MARAVAQGHWHLARVVVMVVVVVVVYLWTEP